MYPHIFNPSSGSSCPLSCSNEEATAISGKLLFGPLDSLWRSLDNSEINLTPSSLPPSNSWHCKSGIPRIFRRQRLLTFFLSKLAQMGHFSSLAVIARPFPRALVIRLATRIARPESDHYRTHLLFPTLALCAGYYSDLLLWVLHDITMRLLDNSFLARYIWELLRSVPRDRQQAMIVKVPRAHIITNRSRDCRHFEINASFHCPAKLRYTCNII